MPVSGVVVGFIEPNLSCVVEGSNEPIMPDAPRLKNQIIVVVL